MNEGDFIEFTSILSGRRYGTIIHIHSQDIGWEKGEPCWDVTVMYPTGQLERYTISKFDFEIVNESR